ncbi:ABC transporter substrate-binding protein [Acidocella aminolytica]|uniref:Extracellular solute-binding protein n=1 Tax=Acidocella aminolytica 101 = DSM 11237 TaxID=1120923 RepID=A0A0D6PG74_9PROT|nr:ABC transporter substrate-binding protein [Acidocella aminolytica]GAN80770.1 extracellular solute-binding protein [Acidocella aminolytica 101 = DSM 11237]SHF51845.1 putative spermidine/putrescine transport system substrate-binding protein [Acidocella aminolytica 101 = DSM 11237]
MFRRTMLTLSSAAAAYAAATSDAFAEEFAICYNCPPEWADWAGQLRAFKKATGITVPYDDKNSGQALAAALAERANPVADAMYLGGQVGIQAKHLGLTQPYKPAGFDEVPAGQKDPEGYWFAIHSGTLGFFVNTDALGSKPVPQSWKDLLNPTYRGMIGYLDPSSAAVGYVGAVAVNLAFGGSYDNFTPAINYFKKLQANQPIVPKQTAYARVLSGEIPILLDYDFDAYRAKYTDKAPAEFVIPQEGTVSFPYVMTLLKGAPHLANGKKLLDFTLSDEGQKLWAAAYLRPARPIQLPAEIEARFLPAKDYSRAKPVDLTALAAAQKGFSARYLAEVS